MKPAKLGDGGIHRALDVGLAGHVSADEPRLVPMPGRSLGGGLFLDVDDHGSSAGRHDHVDGCAAET